MPADPSLYLILLSLVGMASIGAMSFDVILNRVNRVSAAWLLGASLLYAAVNVVTYFLVLSVDRFSIFGLFFMFLAVIGGPLLVTVGTLSLSFVYSRVHWLGAVGFVVWMGCVSVANMGVIAMASAAV